MVRLALMDYITHEAPSVLLSTPQPQMPQRKPMSNQEYKFMREQEMRGLPITRPLSPSQQNDLSEDDWA
jgi:hypothetical protein